MSITYHDLTIPVFIKNLTNLKTFLRRGADHAKESGESEEQFLARQLAPDMFPLVRQVQIATDNAKGAAARLTGTAALAVEDTEVTVAELEARIDRVIEHLRTYTAEQFAGAADAQVTLPYFPNTYLKGSDYMIEYVLPNFFFHMSIAYAIIRHSGVPIGKADFIGGLPLQELQ